MFSTVSLSHSPSTPLLPEVFSTGNLIVDGGTVTLSQSPTVRQIVAQRPRRARVFEKYGISYCCCSGNKTFMEACAEQNVDADKVLAELLVSDAFTRKAPSESFGEWGRDRSGELRRHIVDVHHGFLQSELPRLSYLIDRVANRHGNHYNDLWELQRLFEEFKEEAEWHVEREEKQLFPLLERLEAGEASHELRDSIGKVICTLELEHAYLSQTMACMSALTAGFQVPETACNTFRVMLNSLEELGNVMDFYTGKEASLLFVWAQEEPKLQ
ncbi:hypothetical protein EON80_05320 [bacterium]|nr:MAG: hypothetical protein EON80_05320 [bacterium]